MKPEEKLRPDIVELIHAVTKETNAYLKEKEVPGADDRYLAAHRRSIVDFHLQEACAYWAEKNYRENGKLRAIVKVLVLSEMLLELEV